MILYIIQLVFRNYDYFVHIKVQLSDKREKNNIWLLIDSADPTASCFSAECPKLDTDLKK